MNKCRGQGYDGAATMSGTLGYKIEGLDLSTPKDVWMYTHLQASKKTDTVVPLLR